MLLTVIICACKPTECTSHLHTAKLASFFFLTTAIMEMLMRRKKNVVCLHSSELIGQTRTGVAPA